MVFRHPRIFIPAAAAAAAAGTSYLLRAPFTASDQGYADAQVLDFLGVELPTQVDRGKRLVQIFLGALLSRQSSDERGYRYGGL